ncbi:MAG: dUTP diphosphatase [Bacillaceae bacterium]
MTRKFHKLTEEAILPKRQTKRSAGYDLAASTTVTIQPNEVVLIPTGIAIEIPDNEWAGIYIRSSMALKRGLILPNSVGVIDSDYYPNEVKIMVRNVTETEVVIEKGERVGQVIFHNYLTVSDEEEISVERAGGFGSTTK